MKCPICWSELCKLETVKQHFDKLFSLGIGVKVEPKEEDRRPSFDQIYMQFAVNLSERSTCSRARVGCVVVTADNSQMLSLGYNGVAKGLPHGCVSNEPGKCGCVHSEMNCLTKLNPTHPSEKKIYTTTEPCRLCAILIVNSGISEVIYLNSYRLHEGLDVLTASGIKVSQFAKRDLLTIPEEV